MVARPRFPRAAYLKGVQTLVDVLSQVPVGTMMKLDTLSRLVGWDITTRRHILHDAFRQVRQATGRDFQSVANVGYRVLPELKTPEVSQPGPKPTWFQTTLKPELLARTPTPEPTPERSPAPEANPWLEVEAALRRAVLHTTRQAIDSLDRSP
jgi:hypothetical protein